MEIAMLRRDFDDLKERVDKLDGSIGELVQAWKTAGGMVKIVKWAAGVVTAVAAAYAALKGYFAP